MYCGHGSERRGEPGWRRSAHLLHHTMANHTLLIIRSEKLAWEGVARTLGEMADLKVVGVADDAAAAARLAGELKPNVIVVATRVPSEPLLSLLQHLRDGSPDSLVVVIAESAGELDAALFLGLQQLGVAAILLWSELTPDRFHRCILTVTEDGFVVGSRGVAERFVDALRTRAPSAPSAPPLSGRERRVLSALAADLTHEQIAHAERLSLRTVNRTISDLQLKLGTGSLFSLGAKARTLGLLP